MPRLISEIPGAFVDPACPLEGACPLNRGIVSDWSILPNSGWRGGDKLRDIVRGLRKPNDGTLTNGPKWDGALGRPGGYGSLKFDGTDDCVVLDTNFGDGGTTTPFSWSCWAYTTNAGGIASQQLIGRYDGTNLFQLHFDNTGGGRLKCAYGVSPFDTPASAGGSVTSNVWYHCAFTFSSTGVGTLFLNGREVASDAAVTGAFTSATALNFGRRGGDSAEHLAGGMDEIAKYNRALAASEVATLYAESRRGNPERWRWVSGNSWFVPVAAGGGIVGEAAITLAALTASAACVLPITGAASPTLAALTSSATGTLPIAGASSQTLAALTSNAAGVLPIVGQAAPTLGALTSTAAGTLPITAQASITLGQLTCQAAEGGFTNARTPVGWARRPDVGRGAKRMAERSARRPEVERGARRSRP